MTQQIMTEYAFHLECLDEAGRQLRDMRLGAADFERAIDHTRFDAFRRGFVQEYPPRTQSVTIEPVFPHGDASLPRAAGFRVAITWSPEGGHACQFANSYFDSPAQRIRAECLRTQELANEQKFYYRLNALLDDEPPMRPVNRLGMSLDSATSHLAIGSGCRDAFGPTQAWDGPNPCDVPVLIDLDVLEEIVREARGHSEYEIGGFLLGQVIRDDQDGDIFLVVSGWASASGTTEASGTSVTFTPASFAQVKRIIQLRGLGEMVIGWSHSHPFRLCAECPLPTPAECIAKVLFYSLDDVHLMETTFGQPYMVGLVAGIDPRVEAALGHLPIQLYGWRNGQIKQRGFETISAIMS